MERKYKTHFGYLLMFFAIVSLTSSCKKKESIVEQRFLDVNILFNGSVKPTEGKELIVNLYYSAVDSDNFTDIIPDEVKKVPLTEAHIKDGLRVTFEDFKKVPTAVVRASVDMDEDGSFNYGDLVVYSGGKGYSDVEEGEAIPDNVANEYAITLHMNRVIGLGKLKDIDGNLYETVIIGNQEWMAENLRTTRYNNGDPIATGLSDSEWMAATSGAYAIHPFGGTTGVNSEQEMKEKYGILYNWHAVNDPRGIAPEGWRVATDSDWSELEAYLGMSAADISKTGWRGPTGQGKLLKNSTGWEPYPGIEPGDNPYGFSALPGGYRSSTTGSYDRFNLYAYFWTGTPSATNPELAIRRILAHQYNSINRSTLSRAEGSNVRCIRIK